MAGPGPVSRTGSGRVIQRNAPATQNAGSNPSNINMGGCDIGLRLLIESRGTDINLTADEELIYDAIIRERRLPGGRAILVDPEFAPDDSAS